MRSQFNRNLVLFWDLQEKNKEYREECEFMEKELANIEEEKALILSNMAETLAAGSDAEMAIRNLAGWKNASF